MLPRGCMRSSGVQGALLKTCFDSVVAAAIFSGVVFWSSSMVDRKRLMKKMKKASSVLGCPLDTVEVVGDGRLMAELSSLMNLPVLVFSIVFYIYFH